MGIDILLSAPQLPFVLLAYWLHSIPPFFLHERTSQLECNSVSKTNQFVLSHGDSCLRVGVALWFKVITLFGRVQHVGLELCRWATLRLWTGWWGSFFPLQQSETQAPPLNSCP